MSPRDARNRTKSRATPRSPTPTRTARAVGAPGSAGRAPRGSRHLSRDVVGVVLAGSGKGEVHPEVDIGRLRLLLGGLLVLGLAAGTARAARLAIKFAIRPAEILPGSLASSAPLPRVSKALGATGRQADFAPRHYRIAAMVFTRGLHRMLPNPLARCLCSRGRGRCTIHRQIDAENARSIEHTCVERRAR